MKCWNCGKNIPDAAKVCRHCEAAVVAGPSEEEEEAIGDFLSNAPPEAMEELRAAFAKSDTAEEFVDRIFVGDCPKCGSEDTGNCEADPEIEDFLVGRCYQCGQLWCTECRRLLDPTAPSCDCLDDDEDEDEFYDDDDEIGWDVE